MPAIVFSRFPYESSWGGEESHTLALAKHFQSKGYEVIFFGSCPVLLEKFNELKFQTVKVWGGKMVVTPLELIKSIFLYPFIKWNLARNFKKLLQKHDIKALYCLSLNEKILLSPEAIKNKISVTWVEHQEIRSWLLKNPWRKIYCDLSMYVKIIPINNLNKQKLISEMKIKENNIKEITNGVDIEFISRHSRNTQKNLIVAANRFISKKGLMDLLQCMPELFIKYSTLELRLIGGGEEENAINNFINTNLAGKKISVSYFLNKENWIDLLSRCDVYVSTARDANETFSLSSAEALASGCKLVVTRCSGIADHLTDGLNAFLAEPMNPDSLRLKIENALNSAEELRSNGIKTAREMFDQKRMLEQYESVILRA